MTFFDILGDFNVNVLLNNNSKDTLYETFEQFNLSQLVHQVTTTSGTNTCIDLVFTNCHRIQSSGPINVHLSDHLPVHVIKANNEMKKGHRMFKGRSYKNFDKEAYLTKNNQ